MSKPSTKRYAGKIIGFVLGLILGGVWGAVIGLIIGHLHDRQQEQDPTTWKGLWGPGKPKPTLEQTTFTMGVIILSAKMAKSDGRVTRAEIEAFKRVFHIRPDQENDIGDIFNRERLSAEGFEPAAFKLAQVFRTNPAVLEEILSGLFIIGAADTNGLTPAEVKFLKRVAFIFGFSVEDFGRIAARTGIKLPTGEKKPVNPQAEAFSILGITQKATAEEAKAAYRALIMKHHPDKLIAAGMPAEFVANATEKMKRINVAYDTVCKIKGIK